MRVRRRFFFADFDAARSGNLFSGGFISFYNKQGFFRERGVCLPSSRIAFFQPELRTLPKTIDICCQEVQMICSICQENEAVLFIEQSNVTPPKKLNICLECARQYGITPDSKSFGRSVSALFEAFLSVKSKDGEEARSPDGKKLCPVCGTSLFRIKRSRKAGCPECYEVFRGEISDILKNIGVTSAYTGSRPLRIRNFNSVITKRLAIQGKLEESLRNEDYEKAAVYRDYLRALEKTPVYGADAGEADNGGDDE